MTDAAQPGGLEVGTTEHLLVQRVLLRWGLAGEAAALVLMVFGALVVAFPDLTSWLVGASLFLAGATQLAGHLGARGAVLRGR